MKISMTLPLMVATLAIPSSIGFFSQAQAAPPTQIRCVYEGGSWKTIATKGSAKAVLVEWRTTIGGLSLQQRCEQVSDKLNWLSETHGGNLYGIRMKTGVIKNSSVICYIDNSTATVCNPSNHVMNLSPYNEVPPKEQLQQLFGKIDNPYATGNTLQNSSPEYEVDFGNAVEKTLTRSDNTGINNTPNLTSPEKPIEQNPHQGL